MENRDEFTQALIDCGALKTHEEWVQFYSDACFVIAEEPSKALTQLLESYFSFVRVKAITFDTYLRLWRAKELQDEVKYACVLRNWVSFDWDIEQEYYVDEAFWGDVEYEALIALGFGLTEDNKWIQESMHYPYHRLTPWRD